MTIGPGTERTLTSPEAVIDLHCHLLPGIDDGSRDLQESVDMARAAVDGGVEAIVATPHVSGTYPNDPATFRSLAAQVQGAIDEAGVPLHVYSGAELSIHGYHDLPPDGLAHCGLGDGNYVLLEAPLSGPAPFIDRLVLDIGRKGMRVVLAHPERIAAFHKNIGLLEKLVDGGALTSVTAASLTGQFGSAPKRFAQEMFARGLVHNLASDAHDAHHRGPALRPTLDRAIAEMPDLAEWVDWLTVDVPRAVVDGRALEGEPPRIEPRRGLLGRLRRR